MRIVIAALLSLALSACARAEDRPAAWSEAHLDDLVAVAESVQREGLPPQTAAIEEIARFRHMADTDPVAEVQLYVAADALFTSLARTYAQGGADAQRADQDWSIAPNAEPDFEGLRLARADGALPSALLAPLLPNSAEYAVLRNALAQVSAEAPGALDDNLSREARIVRLRASLERWRWLPRDLPERRIEVRIAQFEARLLASDRTTRTHAVIVGARQTPTPSFETQIRSVTLNPAWEPPPSIVAELVERFRNDPDAAARENFDVLDSEGGALEIASVDWRTRPFRYRLRQRPGPGNALGQIRFDMPNAFAIYLHDTPSRNLFERPMRAFSHGCVRVQAPDELAVDVLQSSDWTVEALHEAIAAGDTRTLAVQDELPVYLIYMTATVSADGGVQYADDIYRRDNAVIAALDGPETTLVQQQAGAIATCAG